MSDRIIVNRLKEDLERINRNLELYENKLDKYPQGYLRCKKVNNKKYYYLRKRDGDKINDTYIKLKDVENTRKSIEKRKFIDDNIKSLKSQKKYMEKILRKELKNDK